jgi:hypothetical protein
MVQRPLPLIEMKGLQQTLARGMAARAQAVQLQPTGQGLRDVRVVINDGNHVGLCAVSLHRLAFIRLVSQVVLRGLARGDQADTNIKCLSKCQPLPQGVITVFKPIRTIEATQRVCRRALLRVWLDEKNMFEFLKIKRSKTTPQPRVAPLGLAPDIARRHSSLMRELVRVVFNDTMRLHGIPPDWLACEGSILRRSTGTEELHVQLVVLVWNEKLLRYAPALQQQLISALERLDPSPQPSQLVFSWRFSPTCRNPFVRMPEPSYWQPREQALALGEPPSVLDRRRHRRSAASPTLKPVRTAQNDRTIHFAPTEIGPLR